MRYFSRYLEIRPCPNAFLPRPIGRRGRQVTFPRLRGGSGRCGFGGQGTDSQPGVAKSLARARIPSRASRKAWPGHGFPAGRHVIRGRGARCGRERVVHLARGEMVAVAAVPRPRFSRRPIGNPCHSRNNRNDRAAGSILLVEARQNDGLPRRTVHLPHLTTPRLEPDAKKEAAPDGPERSSAKRTSRRNVGGGHRSCEDVCYSSSKAPV